MSQQGSLSVLTRSVKLGDTVAAARFVTQAGAYAAANAKAFGVTRIGGVDGDLVPVDVLGTALVELGGTVAVDEAIKVGTDGKGLKNSAGGISVAKALEAGGSGDIVEVQLIPAA